MTTMETWTFYLRWPFLFAGLSYYFIAVLRLTKSPTLLSASVLASTQQVSIEVIENVTDIFFPKMGTFGTVWGLDIFFLFYFFLSNFKQQVPSHEQCPRKWPRLVYVPGEVNSIRIFSVKFKINHYDHPLPPDQHGSYGSQVGQKSHLSQSETNGHGLTTTT